ncbi:MAG: hypothetical protein SFY70_03675 [Bacteroidia bacterium]|nr:hypothetical protein [Bacteroidia bacterium]
MQKALSVYIFLALVWGLLSPVAEAQVTEAEIRKQLLAQAESWQGVAVETIEGTVAMDMNLFGIAMKVEGYMAADKSGRMHMDMTLQVADSQSSMLVVANGDEVWVREPGASEVRAGTPEEVERFKTNFMLDNTDQVSRQYAWYTPKALSSLRLIGEEVVEGTPCYHVTLKGDDKLLEELMPNTLGTGSTDRKDKGKGKSYLIHLYLDTELYLMRKLEMEVGEGEGTESKAATLVITADGYDTRRKPYYPAHYALRLGTPASETPASSPTPAEGELPLTIAIGIAFRDLRLNQPLPDRLFQKPE